jgi:hypothetical protein
LPCATRVTPLYHTTLADTGVLVMPTPREKATLYLLWSESSQSQTVRFTDSASGKPLAVDLPAGRAALVLVARQGES